MFPFLPQTRRIVYWEPVVDGTSATPEPSYDSTASTWAPMETQIALFNRLSNDAGLTTLLNGSGKIFDHVPQNSVFPYVTIFSKPWLDRGNYTNEGMSAIFQINVWYQAGKEPFYGRGDKRVQFIQKRIDELLHNKPLAVDGWKTLILRRAYIDIITDPDGITKHGIQQFKLFLGGRKI